MLKFIRTRGASKNAWEQILITTTKRSRLAGIPALQHLKNNRNTTQPKGGEAPLKRDSVLEVQSVRREQGAKAAAQGVIKIVLKLMGNQVFIDYFLDRAMFRPLLSDGQ